MKLNCRLPLTIALTVFCFVQIGCVHTQRKDLDTQLGAEVADEVEKEMGLVDHQQAHAFIEKVGQRLVSQLGDQPFDYEFHIVDTAEPNAFALPGGYIYFSRGLLLIANTEDELAGVMGHEIIHAHKRHSVKAIKRSIVPGLLTLPGHLVGVVSGRLGRLINAPIKGVTGLTLSRYGRKQETEADTLGVKLAADSGYEPKSLGVILTNLSKSGEVISGEEEKFSYYDGHPYTPNRVKNINKKSQALKVTSAPPLASTRKEFLQRFEGLTIGENPAHGLFRDNKFIQPDLNFSLVFPKGWDTINTPSHVGAFQPDKEAQLFLGIAGKAGEPDLPAKKFIRKIHQEFRTKPTESKEVNLKGNPGYYVSFKDKSSRKSVTIHMLWISMGEHMFEFIGTGYENHKAEMRDSVLSLHPITTEEWAEVKKTTIRVKKAQGGESLESFSQRTGNTLELDLTAAVNNLSQDQKLEDGQLIKIGIKEPYQPKNKKGAIR